MGSRRAEDAVKERFVLVAQDGDGGFSAIFLDTQGYGQ
jgi:hypothetical protein